MSLTAVFNIVRWQYFYCSLCFVAIIDFKILKICLLVVTWYVNIGVGKFDSRHRAGALSFSFNAVSFDSDDWVAGHLPYDTPFH